VKVNHSLSTPHSKTPCSGSLSPHPNTASQFLIPAPPPSTALDSACKPRSRTIFSATTSPSSLSRTTPTSLNVRGDPNSLITVPNTSSYPAFPSTHPLPLDTVSTFSSPPIRPRPSPQPPSIHPTITPTHRPQHHTSRLVSSHPTPTGPNSRPIPRLAPIPPACLNARITSTTPPGTHSCLASSSPRVRLAPQQPRRRACWTASRGLDAASERDAEGRPGREGGGKDNDQTRPGAASGKRCLLAAVGCARQRREGRCRRRSGEGGMLRMGFESEAGEVGGEEVDGGRAESVRAYWCRAGRE